MGTNTKVMLTCYTDEGYYVYYPANLTPEGLANVLMAMDAGQADD